MRLVRKMHMKQKTAYIMKASHCCLEQNAEQKLRMPRSFLGGKVNLHTSHLFSELFIVGKQGLLKGPGRGMARRSTLTVGIKGTWAVKHHMECVQCFGSSGNPHATDIFHINTTKSFSCSTSLSAAANISSEQMAPSVPTQKY